MKDRLRLVTNPAPPTLPLAVKLSTVEPQPVRWLWAGRIPLGKLSCLGGLPGRGKSLITMALAAAVSTGQAMVEGDSPCPAGSVLLLGAEDDAGDTVRPRLDAAGADVERIHCLDMVRTPQGGIRSLSLVSDVLAIDQLVNALGDCRLIIIDPLTAYLGVGDVDAHRDSDIRGILRPLGDLASRHGCAVVIVAHHRKGGGGPADYRMAGSLGVVAACRSVLHVADHPQLPGIRVLAPGKCNLGKPAPALRYQIEEVDGRPVITWLGTEELSADDLLGESYSAPTPKADLAAEWLRDLLSDGPVLGDVVKERGAEAGYSERTLRRALRTIEGQTAKHGFQGKWSWSLKDGQAPRAHSGPPLAGSLPDKGSLKEDVATLENSFEDGQAPSQIPKGGLKDDTTCNLWREPYEIGISEGSGVQRWPSSGVLARAHEDEGDEREYRRCPTPGCDLRVRVSPGRPTPLCNNCDRALAGEIAGACLEA